MDSLEDRWAQFYGRRFPKEEELYPLDFLDLVQLDAALAGCIQTFLEGDGTLDAWRTEILVRGSNDLQKLREQLQQGTGDAYLAELEKLCRDVLKRLRQ